MKALLISEEQDVAEKLKPVLAGRNFDLIHYRSPLKVIDNIQEIAPHAVIINAYDFPRHWKVITQHIRWENSAEKALIILLVNNIFSIEDENKARGIGVQKIIKLETGSFDTALPEIEAVFEEYQHTHNLGVLSAVQFLFTNPINETIITGAVIELTEEHIFFMPDSPVSASGLEKDTVLDRCSLKLGNILLAPACKIVSAKRLMQLTFIDLSEEDKKNIREMTVGLQG